MKEKFYTISEFATFTGLTIKALRLYEKKGLLVPNRAETNQYRLYSSAQIQIAKEIVALKATGFSIQEIKAILPFQNSQNGGAVSILHQQLIQTEKQMAELNQQRTKLKILIKNSKKNSLKKSSLPKGTFAKKIICRQISESIKMLSEADIKEKTRQIPSEEYLRTVAMVDDVAKAKLLSILSENAVSLVKEDLAKLDREYAKYWR